jgi:hypothetical protein
LKIDSTKNDKNDKNKENNNPAKSNKTNQKKGSISKISKKKGCKQPKFQIYLNNYLKPSQKKKSIRYESVRNYTNIKSSSSSRQKYLNSWVKKRMNNSYCLNKERTLKKELNSS